MTTAQEILSQHDVFLAIKQKRAEKQVAIREIEQSLSKIATHVISPLPRANNKMDYAMQIARNAFSIWQGISLGLKIVKGFRSAFKK